MGWVAGVETCEKLPFRPRATCDSTEKESINLNSLISEVTLFAVSIEMCSGTEAVSCFKAHRRLHHSTLGLRVMKKKKTITRVTRKRRVE